MKTYDTLSEALTDLEKRGFTHDFNVHATHLECKKRNEIYKPETFTIVEMYRFEGMSSADDNSVVYAIETNTGVKGTLVDAYGVYADSLSSEMIEKLHFKR
ncbi:phosphoribosylpyrophosphate synthetase [Tenacibaculum sp. UWU-22]|uniref:phosphoribosylpyrophosphate synthetase n=1 Tax=Tenacibaculum sp. UWU-22 TaxID=3234187 RepID=UPI0034DB46C5